MIELLEIFTLSTQSTLTDFSKAMSGFGLKQGYK
jgi:hypothetical protein